MRQWCIQTAQQLAFVTAYVMWTVQSRRAQSTVEYALVGALVVIAAAAALTLLGEQVTSVFTGLTKALGGPPAR